MPNDTEVKDDKDTNTFSKIRKAQKRSISSPTNFSSNGSYSVLTRSHNRTIIWPTRNKYG
jgi:hypothetical protein